jgi:tubulin polyglutamylase complex subunit 2
MAARNAKAAFDEISLNVVSYLENHKEISGLQIAEKGPVTQRMLEQWEKDNYPFRLPDDLKSFLLLSNGLMIRWYMNLKDELCPLGCMHLNSIAQIKPISMVGARIRTNYNVPLEESDDEDADPLAQSRTAQEFGPWAFDLDASCTSGRVALVYAEKSPSAAPAVWFQDLACTWHEAAAGFADYFRVMCMHLGLPNWQYCFSDVGMDAVTTQWLRLLAPERCFVDMQHSRDRQNGLLMQAASHYSGALDDKTKALAKEKNKGDSKVMDMSSVEDSASALLARKAKEGDKALDKLAEGEVGPNGRTNVPRLKISGQRGGNSARRKQAQGAVSHIMYMVS